MDYFPYLVSLCLWNGLLIPVGVGLVGYSRLLGLEWAWVLFYVWVVGNFVLAYFLNQSRKHSKRDVLDDKLSAERMEKAKEWWIKNQLGEAGKREDDDERPR